MKLPELLRAVSALAETGGSEQQYADLTSAADNLVNMVDWAGGPIDPGGQWLSRLSVLQDDLQYRQAKVNDPAIELLYDTLTKLGRAIAQHDAEYEAGKAGDDEGEDFN